MHTIRPGDTLTLSTADSLSAGLPANDSLPAGAPTSQPKNANPENSTIAIKIKRGRHVRFDVLLILRTIFSPRIIRFRENLKLMATENRVFKESGETVIYEISCCQKTITVLGSLGLADNAQYSEATDLLVLPDPGSSHLVELALAVVSRLRPRTVMLDHFDDAFPPISRMIDISPFVAVMRKEFPDVQVIVPERGATYDI
jgi:hypothetical protein